MPDDRLVFDSQSARRIIQQTMQGERRQRNRAPRRNWRSPVGGEVFLSVDNISGEDIPPYALMAVGANTNDEGPRPQVDVFKPSTATASDLVKQHIFNSGSAIPSGEPGTAVLTYPTWARFEGTPFNNLLAGPSAQYGTDPWAISTDAVLTRQPVWRIRGSKVVDGVTLGLVYAAQFMHRPMVIEHMTATAVTSGLTTLKGGTPDPNTGIQEDHIGVKYNGTTGVITLLALNDFHLEIFGQVETNTAAEFFLYDGALPIESFFVSAGTSGPGSGGSVYVLGGGSWTVQAKSLGSGSTAVEAFLSAYMITPAQSS